MLLKYRDNTRSPEGKHFIRLELLDRDHDDWDPTATGRTRPVDEFFAARTGQQKVDHNRPRRHLSDQSLGRLGIRCPHRTQLLNSKFGFEQSSETHVILDDENISRLGRCAGGAQLEAEARTLPQPIRLGPHLATVSFDNSAADRKAKTC